jgi:hypothetical protein
MSSIHFGAQLGIRVQLGKWSLSQVDVELYDVLHQEILAGSFLSPRGALNDDAQQLLVRRYEDAQTSPSARTRKPIAPNPA